MKFVSTTVHLSLNTCDAIDTILQVFQTYEHKVKSWGWKGELDLETSKLKLTHLPVLFGSCLNATDLKVENSECAVKARVTYS